jgi:urease accessory protein
MRRHTPLISRGLGATVTLMTFLAAAAVTPAYAHHVMDGKLPSTFVQGLLSGFGHPVIGPDHLAFIIAVGIASSLLPRGIGVIAAFVAASTAGVLVHVARFDVPMAEALVALSLVVAGALLMATRSGRTFGGGVWIAFAAVAGLLHGYAFGESIVGSETGALGGYLVGLAGIAAAIALTVRWAMQKWLLADYGASTRIRMAGGVLGALGIVLLISGSGVVG